MSSNICPQRYLLQNRPQVTHKSPRKSLLHSPANTPLGLLEPLKDSSPSQNAKIHPMEFPRRDSQHSEGPARKHRTYTERYVRNIM